MIDEAQTIINHRRAELINIESADQIFTQILEKVKSLYELENNSPLSKPVAIATVKRYLVESRHRIRLHDLIHEETKKVYRIFSSENFITNVNGLTEELFQQRVYKYEAIIDQLLAMLIALSYHDKDESAYLLKRCIEWLTRIPRHEKNVALINLQYYPALLITYSTGISALATNHFNNLAAILKESEYKEFHINKKLPTIMKLNVWSVFTNGTNNWVPRQNAENEYTPVSNYLFDYLHSLLHDYLPDDIKYEETFNIFEYLLALTYLDLIKEDQPPIGRFGWLYKGYTDRFGLVEDNWDNSPLYEFIHIGLAQGSGWKLLKAGFFDGSIERFKEVVESHNKLLQEKTKRWI